MDQETTPPNTTPAPPPAAAPAPANDEPKDYLIALLLSILLGQFGIDRFYMGYVGLGILKLLTAGGCGIWWLIDIVLIATKNLKDAKGRPLVEKR